MSDKTPPRELVRKISLSDAMHLAALTSQEWERCTYAFSKHGHVVQLAPCVFYWASPILGRSQVYDALSVWLGARELAKTHFPAAEVLGIVTQAFSTVPGSTEDEPPSEECELCGGKGMDSWASPFDQSTAAVCPDCLGDGRKKSIR